MEIINFFQFGWTENAWIGQDQSRPMDSCLKVGISGPPLMTAWLNAKGGTKQLAVDNTRISRALVQVYFFTFLSSMKKKVPFQNLELQQKFLKFGEKIYRFQVNLWVNSYICPKIGFLC